MCDENREKINAIEMTKKKEEKERKIYANAFIHRYITYMQA